MTIWANPITLADVNQRSENTAASHLDIKFTEIGVDYLVATMPISNKSKQPFGLLHGGISVALAETVASSAANYCVDQQRFYCVGLDINANHIKSVSKGIVTATTCPIHIGRKTHVWEIKINDDSDSLVCISRLTVAVISR
ncbi:MAG: hotdog fold thioesterase [Legionellales bacterium]|jgi:1,4-dihydroxy-2-naphthoyl-CoA hydrolase|nr:hotdog fold thioesterase [Legionellales bacterium]